MKLKRMKLKHRTLCLALLTSTAFVLTACGGGDEKLGRSLGKRIAESSQDQNTGVFLDSAVQGLDYVYNGNSSKTINGMFIYPKHASKAITFKLGEMTLGSTMPKSVVTPADLTTDSNEVVRILQVLQSVDNDNDLKNGIDIDKNVAKRFTAGDFQTLIQQKDDDKFAEHLKSKLNSNQHVQSPQKAQQHFYHTIQTHDAFTKSTELAKLAQAFVGTWQSDCKNDLTNSEKTILSYKIGDKPNEIVETKTITTYAGQNCVDTQYHEKTQHSPFVNIVFASANFASANQDNQQVVTMLPKLPKPSSQSPSKEQVRMSQLIWQSSDRFIESSFGGNQATYTRVK